eukprot:TRINITY_DN4735_c0_g1_i1.p1 TRINITY_DN4735_c0_g1~~TRINITY_DN4735_c0_g1_i1.p1  ORF type:complete len:127 (+),score=13.64 TRINITY_DN4735_c0_g1_i1:35-382(+)
MVLDVYQKMRDDGVTLPLRIEHTQCLNSSDIPRFATINVIPSMQPIHAVEDMNFALHRLGPERIVTAYSPATLINSGVSTLLFNQDATTTKGVNMFPDFTLQSHDQNTENQPPGG